ncbi:MAG TPA: sulfite exporter TauE/SafE family protein [Proteobacteria bacterium]|nr:sulfite exporter TauE/SafE family protein [Pseudomonadota bacterium]
MVSYLWLSVLSLALGAIGTLIGAGGGFVLVPVLLLLYPQESPQTITSISLAVVFCNALSGSLAYAWKRRIDYRSGLLFAAATIPGAVIGALTTDFFPRRLFNVVFGIIMIAAALYLAFFRETEPAPARTGGKQLTSRKVVESNGKIHVFSYNLNLGLWLSLFVGYLSSLLGIGGGIVHVPILVRLLNFPVHLATATSHFILAIMALAGTIVHMLTGSFSESGVQLTIFLGLGVMGGAQLGARLSDRMRGSWIIRGLATALAFVGLRILMLAWSS